VRNSKGKVTHPAPTPPTPVAPIPSNCPGPPPATSSGTSS
jgi:hypothetical protein